MESISFSNPTLPSPHSLPRMFRRYVRPFVVKAERDANDGSDYKGKLVDENMIVLRMRMKKVEMAETSSRLPLPEAEKWMEWERKYYEQHYNEDVCEAMGYLQMCLMNTRPGLAIGVVALLMLCVPLAATVVIYNVLGFAKFLLSGFN